MSFSRLHGRSIQQPPYKTLTADPFTIEQTKFKWGKG